MDFTERFLELFIISEGNQEEKINNFINSNKQEIVNDLFVILKMAYFSKVDISIILEYIIDIPEIREKINSRLDYVLACCTSGNITDVLKLLEDIDKIKEIRERRFQTNTEDEKLEDIIISKLVDIRVDELREESILPFLKQLFNEVLEIEKMNIGDIRYISKGTTSTVYRVGSVVFKFGKDRRTPKYKGHPNILKPILRMAIPKIKNEPTVEDTYLDEDKLLFIEIQPYLDSDKKLPMGYNTLWDLSQKLKSDRTIWEDWSEENIAIINFKNEVNYGGITYVAPEATGIVPEDDGITPYTENGGTPVLVDADDIEEEKDDDER